MSKWVEIKLIREGKTPTLAVRCPRCLHVPLWLGSPILPTNSGNLDYCPHCGMDMKGVDSEDLIKRSDALEVAYKYCPDDDGSCSCADRDLQEMLDDIEDIPSADKPSEIIYGNKHNCIMTIFGECSYAETGCGDCAVVKKVRKALSAYEPREDSVSKRYLLAEIDDLADEFSEVDENGLHSERWCGIVDAKMVIMNAPVMVDEPQGEWILQENKHHIEKTYLCSNCKSFEAWGESEKYKYCPNCRAKNERGRR